MIDLFKIGFLSIRLLDIVDIGLMAYLLYKLYYLLKGSAALNITFGIVSIYVLWLVFDKVLNMQLLGNVLEQFINVGVILTVIIFQQEIRKFLFVVGRNNILVRSPLIAKLLGMNQERQIQQEHEVIEPIVKACFHMARHRVGAIICITRETDLELYINSGTLMEARISRSLLESIFAKNSPLHDGAVIITGTQIIAASCVLPLSKRYDLPAYMGMRHRSAIGLSEESDALVLVVSEQTGAISLISDGNFLTNLTADELEKKLIHSLS